MSSHGHVVFDCDGTLVSSMGSVYLTAARVFSKFLNREVTLDDVRENFEPSVEKACAKLGIKGSDNLAKVMQLWNEEARESSREVVDEYPLYPGVEELISNLAEDKFNLYVWTARDRKSTEKILSGHHIGHYFCELRSGTCAPLKPNPHALEEMIGQAHSKQTVVIGDSYTDILGAKNFGGHAIGAAWESDCDRASLVQYGADKMAKTPGECLAYIKELIG